MKIYAYTTAAAEPNYRYYIAAGTVHTILMSPEFYAEESAGGVLFTDWIKTMIKIHNKWENLEFENCFP